MIQVQSTSKYTYDQKHSELHKRPSGNMRSTRKARGGNKRKVQTERQTYRFAGTGIQTQERDLDMVMDSRTRKDLTKDRSGSTA